MSGRRSRTSSHLRARPATACGLRGRLGAASRTITRQPAFWTPVSDTAWLAGGRGAFPHLSLDRAKPGLDRGQCRRPALRRRGGLVPRVRRRDAPLALQRADHSGVARVRPRCSSSNMASAAYRRARQLTRFIASGYLVEATSLEELARKIEVDAAGLRQTVQRAQSVRRDRRRRGVRQGLDRLRPPQRRSAARAQSMPRPDRDAALLRHGRLSQHARLQRRAARGCGRPRIDAKRRAHCRACSLAATTWPRSCAGIIPGPASRSAPPLSLPIVQQRRCLASSRS